VNEPRTSLRAPCTIPLEDGPVSAFVDRAAAVSVALVVGPAVVVMAMVHPDARGVGTHEQLGLEACGWPVAYGLPCPTCGCTTAACHVVHGHLLTAFVVQPFGALFMIASILLGAHAVWCLLRRRSFADILVRLPVWRLLGAGLLILLAAWGYKCIGFTP
jgi:hypothetical protein